MWQDNQSPYVASSSQSQYYPQHPVQSTPLQFYDQGSFYPSSRSSLEGNVGPQGSIAQGNAAAAYGGQIQPAGGWWTAFGTGGFEGEPPLLEGTCSHTLPLVRAPYQDYTSKELGINFSHISAKSMTVLNPLRRVDERIMDDADLAGPLLFCFCFGTFLLFVSGPNALQRTHAWLSALGGFRSSQENHNSDTSTVSAS